MAGEWGTREEFLHPRDSHGRFRKSWKMAASVIEKISDALARFNPKTFPDQDQANNYVRSLAQSDRFRTNRGAFMDRFLKGFSKVNADLRAGKTDNPDVAAMDKAMRPLPEDLILSRVVGPEAFGLDASSVHQIEEYTGKLVADKGYSSTNIGTPHRRQGGITMVIAAPAGTRAVAPGTGTPTSEIILDRDQPFRITKVSPDGSGGFYVMAVATEKGAPGETRTRTLGNAAPAPNAQEISQPPATPGQAPQAPAGQPVAPQAPQVAPQATPVRTGKPGRPAMPVQPRNEPVHAESIGGNAPATPQTPETQRPTPNAPEATPTPAPAPAPEAPPTPEEVPDRRADFREAFKRADVPVPGQGPRRATYNKAYLDLSLRKGDPAEIARRLDDEIALNDATIKSDRLDGTDSGPLPEDNRRLKLFSQFLKDHFGLEGAKPQEKESPAPAKAAKKAAPSTPEPKKAAEAAKTVRFKRVLRDIPEEQWTPKEKEVANQERQDSLKRLQDRLDEHLPNVDNVDEYLKENLVTDVATERERVGLPYKGFDDLEAAAKSGDIDRVNKVLAKLTGKKETPGSVSPSPKMRERTTPVPSKEEQQRMLNEPRKRVQGPKQPGKAIPSNDFLKPGDKVYKSNGDVKTIKSVGEAGEVTYTDGTTSRDRHRLHEDSIAGAQDRFMAKKGASKRISPEERAARTVSRQQTRTGPAPERKVQENVPLAEPSDEAKGIRDQWLKDAGVDYDGLTDLEKVGVNLMAEQVASKKITRLEAQRRLAQSSLPNLNKVSGSVKTKKAVAAENAMTEVRRIREQGAEIAKREGLPAPKTDQEAAKLVMGERAPKPVPAPARPNIPAKDLSDKGLLQRFEAEIKKDNPDEKRLKELGDELDRRDLESVSQIKALSDDDLEKEFQDEIRKDDLDQARVDRLGAELDRRDHERAQNERKVDALVAKGRSYQDAYAEVHGLDPEKMDREARLAAVDAQRRSGESREATIRRLYDDDLRRQYVDAENATRGHLLTPEGRSKGIDPKSLFQGSSTHSNKWASDELKEYWEKNPRKTYTQFKADLLNRPQDVAAAEKTRGIQKDLDLGMKIERGPRKNIKAPSDVEAAYRRTTIAQLRQQAKDNGIEVPGSLRLKQDIFDHVTKELAKREQTRRAGTSEAPKAETPKPSRSIGEPGTKGLNQMTIAEMRRHAEEKDIQIPRALRTKKDITDWLADALVAKERGEEPIHVPTQTEIRKNNARARAHLKEMEREERLTNIEKASIPQLHKIAEAEGIRVPKFLKTRDDIAAHIKWERTFKRPSENPAIPARVELYTANPAETEKNALRRQLKATLDFRGGSDWSEVKRNRIAQSLNDYMEEEGSASPWRLRNPGGEEQSFIRDIDSVMERSPLSEDQTLWRGIGNASDIFTPEQLKGSLKGTSFNDKGYASTSPNREVSERFAESGPYEGILTRLHVPKGTKAIHLADEDQDEVLLERGLKFDVTGDTGPGTSPRILDITVSKAPADAPETPKAVRQASGKAPTVPGAPERYVDIGGRLKASQSREEAQQILADEKLTVPQLRALADSLNIAVRGNKNDILRDLVHWTVGRRLDSAAVSRPSDTGRELRDITGVRAPGDLKVSTKSVLPNHWGTGSGEIEFHADGHLGRALATLGNDGLLEVPGENDNVANVVGRLATQAQRGRITQNQLIERVRAVRDKMSASLPVRRALDRALKGMEAPDIKVPDLPDGTPASIQKLMKGLADIPLARQDRIGHTDSSELRRLADIMDEWSKGRMTPTRLISELGSRVINQRHESEEGKHEIDRIVGVAIKELEGILRTDRKSLYPPIMRSE